MEAQGIEPQNPDNMSESQPTTLPELLGVTFYLTTSQTIVTNYIFKFINNLPIYDKRGFLELKLRAILKKQVFVFLYGLSLVEVGRRILVTFLQTCLKWANHAFQNQKSTQKHYAMYKRFCESIISRKYYTI
jgi:hypothetical protein